MFATAEFHRMAERLGEAARIFHVVDVKKCTGYFALVFVFVVASLKGCIDCVEFFVDQWSFVVRGERYFSVVAIQVVALPFFRLVIVAPETLPARE